MNKKIIITKGDITKIKVDAIVNAANSSLLGGGGVDGAIHRQAGPELFTECLGLKGCATGEAKITKGYNLPSKHVIHTVGPQYVDGHHQEPYLLRDCYLNSLKLAEENGIESISFPAISTGVYRYPIKDAVKVAYKAIRDYFLFNPMSKIQKVVFVLFDSDNYEAYLNNKTDDMIIL